MSKPFRVLPLLLALLLLTACAPATEADDFAYANTAFTATIRGTYTPPDGNPRPVEAKVTIDAPTPSADGRGMAVTFTSPAALADITVSAVWAPDEANLPRKAVTFTAPSSYGTVTATADDGPLGGFLRFAEALLPRGDITAVTPADENGTRAVTRKTADGAWEGVYTFAKGQALPARVIIVHEGERLELAVEP